MKKVINKPCTAETEVYSRITGYFRAIKEWNKGKQKEYSNRVTFDIGTKKVKKERVVTFKNGVPKIEDVAKI